MGWKEDRKYIQRLMDQVNAAESEDDPNYKAANDALNRELEKQPIYKRFNALYRK